ncbi:RNI-like protein [Gigaspora margarita]|uniref:RNI-like protein n=1 Tax=Gigaspora margarita TaxID=4874 RepID=A0A8H4EUQ9_GIGMA|nr:RNI-like protein [Gigaspora margarita]
MFLQTSKKLKDLSIHCEIVYSLLSRIFDKCTLTSLILLHNELGTEGGNVLTEVLHKNTTLTHLENLLGPEVGKVFAKVLFKNTTLFCLNLSKN